MLAAFFMTFAFVTFQNSTKRQIYDRQARLFFTSEGVTDFALEPKQLNINNFRFSSEISK
jgi:hypothetical protein